ncbi:hypothetical protein BDW72DRAFT_164853 [Aspergillus terricola var. indicus]
MAVHVVCVECGPVAPLTRNIRRTQGPWIFVDRLAWHGPKISPSQEALPAQLDLQRLQTLQSTVHCTRQLENFSASQQEKILQARDYNPYYEANKYHQGHKKSVTPPPQPKRMGTPKGTPSPAMNCKGKRRA